MSALALGLVLLSTLFHAGWNLFAHTHRGDAGLFLRAALVAGLVGVGPALWLQFAGQPLPPLVWLLLPVTGFFQAVYLLGLFMGYRSGDFTVVYPVARALPVLALALADTLRGRSPTALGMLGMLLVTVGCLLAPLVSLHRVPWERYRNRTLLWVLVTAGATVGYTLVDKIALERAPPGLLTAARYGSLQWFLAVPYLYAALRWLIRVEVPLGGRRQWRQAALMTLFVVGAYIPILWVYQLTPRASYVVALRQFSIVLGVVGGILVFHEPAARLRLTAALLITGGIALVSLG